MKTTTYRTLKYLILLMLAAGLLTACRAATSTTTAPATPTTTGMATETATAAPPTATSTSSTIDQQAADTVTNFLQSLLNDPNGTSSMAYLTEDLQADVESGNVLTTLLGIDNMYRSFGVNTLQVDKDGGQAIVEAGLNYGSPITRDFILTEEGGQWLINTILSYAQQSMSLPDDRIASAQVIIDYYQYLADGQAAAAMDLLTPDMLAQTSESDVTAAANEIQGLTTTSLKLVQASPDAEIYTGTFWVLPDSEDSGDWVTGSNTRWIALEKTSIGWRIAQLSLNPISPSATETPQPTATTEPPTPTVESPTPTGTAVPCTLTANSDVTLYNRPDTGSGQFGVLSAGEQATMGGQAANGWLGFDPAVAQAANVGIFRLRWVAPGSDVTQAGSCDTLPQYPTISPTACYEMAMADISVYDQPADTATVIATLPAGEYTAITGKNAQNWYQVDLGDGSLADTHSGQTGWIAPAAANFNGQSCSTLPTVQP